jgi:sporadic carbohydrate cluster 2OG-Fe(II) oxygenase
MTDPIAEFEAQGFAVVSATDRATLDRFRVAVRDLAYEILGATVGDDVGTDLDRLHEHVAPGDPATSFRLALTRAMTDRLDTGREAFDAFQLHLAQLVGVDVLAQRVPNVVFQPPGDPRPTELHRDAPANSPYEVVVWLPLVDCADTKSMYLLDRTASTEVIDFHRTQPDDVDGLQRLLEERAVLMEVPLRPRPAVLARAVPRFARQP